MITQSRYFESRNQSYLNPLRKRDGYQNPMTTPETMLNCSRARRLPLISFGDISLIYNGARQLSIPTPHPPTARPINKTHNFLATACKNPPTRNTTHPSRIVRFRLYLSATDEHVKLPKKAPSSREEVSIPFINGVSGKSDLKYGMTSIADTIP
jgi:hypothetical protein